MMSIDATQAIGAGGKLIPTIRICVPEEYQYFFSRDGMNELIRELEHMRDVVFPEKEDNEESI